MILTHFENGEQCDGSIILASVHNLKMVGKCDVTNSLQSPQKLM